MSRSKPRAPQHGAWIPDDIWAGTPFVQAAQEAEDEMWAAAASQAEEPRHDVRPNCYPGACARCTETVPAKAGSLYRTPAGRWAVVHITCP